MMLSGVGPAAHLSEHNVPIIRDLPGVGSHLIDHAAVNLRFKDKSESTAAYLMRRWPRDIPRIITTVLQYKLFRTGPLASGVSS
jgi:choline dehydrogenase